MNPALVTRRSTGGALSAATAASKAPARTASVAKAALLLAPAASLCQARGRAGGRVQELSGCTDGGTYAQSASVRREGASAARWAARGRGQRISGLHGAPARAIPCHSGARRRQGGAPSRLQRHHATREVIATELRLQRDDQGGGVARALARGGGAQAQRGRYHGDHLSPRKRRSEAR